ncbi:MAG: dicarboxylate/amino acid:cation symporter [Pseudomonadales bacterium]|nr:dicarboxylate/amino acid:cation symporter [Pseudomonadales bacterium]
MSLTNRILIAMVAGILLGSLFSLLLKTGALPAGLHGLLAGSVEQGGLFDAIGNMFVASLKMLVVPLVLVSLICGASSLGDSARMGPIAVKTLGLYLATTALAITIALLFALLIGPGSGIDLVTTVSYTATPPPPLADVLVDIIPSNPVQAMAEGKMLQIIVFALLVGYAISHAGEGGRRIASFFRDMETVVMKMVEILMLVAPYGVFALLVKLFSTEGLGAIADLAGYFFTVLAVLLFHGLVVYGILFRLMARLSPRQLFSKMRPVWAFAFSTASSGATLPVTLNTVERRLGVHNSVAGFTIPLGATINMDGTAIMQGVATVFIAQVYGIDLTVTALMTVILTATLASIGTAAVPGVGLITLTLVLEQAGLPVEGIALILGVDRLLDMVRTAVNVTGDAVVTLIVAKSEGQFEEAVFNQTGRHQAAQDLVSDDAPNF